jgi:Bacteriophage Lambda NinG protein.
MTLPSKPRKPKKCKNPACDVSFPPQRLGQAVCSPKCGLAIKDVNADKARKGLADVGRKELRAAKERVKPKGQYMREAQAVINRYVRLRDTHLGCVSCDKPASWGGQWHCSHFRSVGAAAHLRFNLWNMNKSCSACNNFLSGNISGYRPKLIEKIGQDKVDWLERNQDVTRHDIPYLKRLKAVFAKKVKRIEQRYEGSQSWAAM